MNVLIQIGFFFWAILLDLKFSAVGDPSDRDAVAFTKTLKIKTLLISILVLRCSTKSKVKRLQLISVGLTQGNLQ